MNGRDGMGIGQSAEGAGELRAGRTDCPGTPIPRDDQERVRVLEEYGILDSAPEQSFDDLTGLAVRICGTRCSTITMVDRDRQWFKSRVGVEHTETPRDESLCAHAIVGREMLLIEDSWQDDRFANHPSVVGGPQIRFYAGVPLVSPEGHAVGTICVFDGSPRRLSESQRTSLEALGRQTMRLLEQRRKEEEVRAAEERRRWSEEEFRAAFEHAAIGMMLVGPDGRFTLANGAYCRITGYSPEELGAMDLQALTHPEDMPETRRLGAALMSGAMQSYVLEKRYIRKDGEVIWVKQIASLMRDGNGAPRRAIGLIEEITERKLEETRSREQVQAEENQRELTRMIVETAPAGIAVLDGELRFRWFNPYYLTLLHPSSRSRDLIGVPIREILPPTEIERVTAVMESVRDTGQTFSATEYRLESFERGATYWRWSMLRLATGDLLLVITEITEQVTARKELESMTERLRLAYRAARLGAFDWNLREGTTYWSEDVYAVTGIDAANELNPELYFSHVHPEDDAELRRRVAEDIESAASDVSYEHRLIGSDGQTRWMHVAARIERDEQDDATRMIGTLADVTLRKQTEDALRKTEKLAVVGQLAASIAHEINNPLESVTNLLYLMGTGATAEENTNYVRMAQEEMARASNIVTQTLRFHRQSTSAAEVMVAEIVDSVLALFQGRLTNAEIEIRRQYRQRIPLRCFDADMRQVITNLLSNAIDAIVECGRDGGRIVVRVSDVVHGASGRPGVRLTVADNGHGMSAQTLKHLFEPFYTTKGMMGIGLGLWVSREIIDKHGASVAVKSRMTAGASGTVFTLFFPQAG